MRRVVWTAWTVVFGIALLFVVVTHTDVLFSDRIYFVWTVLLTVGLVACLKAARAERRGNLDRSGR